MKQPRSRTTTSAVAARSAVDGRQTRVRRVGRASSALVAGVGLLYLVVIGSWLALERTPSEPIGDPYLLWMEILTILSAVGITGLVSTFPRLTRSRGAPWSFAALVSGLVASTLTVAVHFVQITAVRQMWRSGALVDYRLIWPSPIFAVEYLAWDLFVGLTMIFMALALRGHPSATSARRALALGGLLCLAGYLGPVTGRMMLQNAAVLGYAFVLPVSSILLLPLFTRADASE